MHTFCHGELAVLSAASNIVLYSRSILPPAALFTVTVAAAAAPHKVLNNAEECRQQVLSEELMTYIKP